MTTSASAYETAELAVSSIQSFPDKFSIGKAVPMYTRKQI